MLIVCPSVKLGIPPDFACYGIHGRDVVLVVATHVAIVTIVFSLICWPV